jgi:hypothetical protein
MSQDNTKLIATALGAAAAGAAAAVAIMKMTDKDKDGGGYEQSHSRNYLPPTFIYGSSEAQEVGMKRNDSESLLFPHNYEEKMRRRVATRYSIEEENDMPRDLVTVRVPATSANIGPGCKF